MACHTYRMGEGRRGWGGGGYAHLEDRVGLRRGPQVGLLHHRRIHHTVEQRPQLRHPGAEEQGRDDVQWLRNYSASIF